MQPNVRYFKIWILFHQKNNFKCQSFTSSGCKNIGIRKLDLVGKTQFRLVKAKTLEYDQKTDKNDALLSDRILQPGVEPGDLEYGGDY